MSKKNAKKNTETEAAVKGTPGRKPAVINYPRGKFTIKDLFAKNSLENGGTIKVEVTARNAVKRALLAGEIVELEKVKTGGVGAPAQEYILASVQAANEKRKKNRKPKAKSKAKPVAKVETSEPVAEPVTEVVTEPAELVAA